VQCIMFVHPAMTSASRQPAENSRRCAVNTDAFYTSRELNTLVIRLAEFKKQIEELSCWA
jgi:hypothetical protein